MNLRTTKYAKCKAFDRQSRPELMPIDKSVYTPTAGLALE